MSWAENMQRIVDCFIKFPFKKEYSYGSVEVINGGHEVLLINNAGEEHVLHLESGEWGETQYSANGRRLKTGVPMSMNKTLDANGKLQPWGWNGSENHWTTDIWNHLKDHASNEHNVSPKLNFDQPTYSDNFWVIK